MEPIVSVLKEWRGRPAMETLLESRGFGAHKLMQQDVARFAPDMMDGVEKYWDEAALEVVTSGGRVMTEHRSFRVSSGYRSEYIDQLARGITNFPDFFRDGGGHFVPGLKVYHEATNSRLSEKKRLELTHVGLSEVQDFKLNLSSWGDTARSAYTPYCDAFGDQLGFQKVRNWWLRERADGLCLRYKIDSFRGWEIKVPILMEIFHKSNMKRCFDIWPRSIIPGYYLYEDCLFDDAPIFGVLGLWACLNLLDAIDETTPSA